MYRKIIILFLLVLVLPLLSFGQTPKKSLSKVSFDFIDADVRNVLRLLTEISGKNLIIAEDVKGKVTMKLDNITWEEALDAVVKNGDLVKVEEENLIRVITTKKFEDERLKEGKRKDELFNEKLLRSKLGIDLISKEIKLKYASADEVKRWISGETTSQAGAVTPGGPTNRPPSSTPGATPAAISERTRGLLSESGVVTTVPWNTRVITIKDTKENIEDIERRLKALDVAPAQVQIEARIVEANSNFSRDLGIKWAARLQTTIRSASSPVLSDKNVALGAIGAQPPSITSPTPGLLPAQSAGTVGVLVGTSLDSNYLYAELSAMEREGMGKIISSPKVVTSNYKEAKISAGFDIPYPTAGQYGTNTEFRKAELELKVTPQVIGDEIKLEISAKKNEPGTGNPPSIRTREITAKEIIIKDGETVVLGGIYDKTENTTETGVPFLRSLPIIGWLFKNQQKVDNRTELLIFVTPRVIRNLYKEED